MTAQQVPFKVGRRALVLVKGVWRECKAGACGPSNREGRWFPVGEVVQAGMVAPHRRRASTGLIQGQCPHCFDVNAHAPDCPGVEGAIVALDELEALRADKVRLLAQWDEMRVERDKAQTEVLVHREFLGTIRAVLNITEGGKLYAVTSALIDLVVKAEELTDEVAILRARAELAEGYIADRCNANSEGAGAVVWSEGEPTKPGLYILDSLDGDCPMGAGRLSDWDIPADPGRVVFGWLMVGETTVHPYGSLPRGTRFAPATTPPIPDPEWAQRIAANLARGVPAYLAPFAMDAPPDIAEANRLGVVVYGVGSMTHSEVPPGALCEATCGLHGWRWAFAGYSGGKGPWVALGPDGFTLEPWRL